MASDGFVPDFAGGGQPGKVPDPVTSGGTRFLRDDATWSVPPGLTSGTVKSVALTMPSGFTVAGSPITVSGTLAVTLASQTQRLFLASPNAASGAPTFRAIVGSDVPVMVASGASHAVGVVPDPGASAGTTRFLREDATWSVPPNSGGTVTSVTLTVPTILLVSGSPVTGSGTLAVSLATQNAHLAWLGPLSGSPAAPTFRAIDYTDLPAFTGPGAPGIVPDSTGHAGTFLKADGTWDTPSGVTSGTVTSVALTMPAIFGVAGSPINSSGTLAVTLHTQAAHTAWLGPLSGADAAPTFRAIDHTDLPTFNGPTVPGIVPDPGATHNYYLRDDGTWHLPSLADINLQVTDGTTTVSHVTLMTMGGMSVTDNGGGDVAISTVPSLEVKDAATGDVATVSQLTFVNAAVTGSLGEAFVTVPITRPPTPPTDPTDKAQLACNMAGYVAYEVIRTTVKKAVQALSSPWLDDAIGWGVTAIIDVVAPELIEFDPLINGLTDLLANTITGHVSDWFTMWADNDFWKILACKLYGVLADNPVWTSATLAAAVAAIDGITGSYSGLMAGLATILTSFGIERLGPLSMKSYARTYDCSTCSTTGKIGGAAPLSTPADLEVQGTSGDIYFVSKLQFMNATVTGSGDDAQVTVDTSGGAGVTSVALTASNTFDITGSPVTSTGTLHIAWHDQHSAYAMLGPVSGADDTPGFRAILASDLPAFMGAGSPGIVPDSTGHAGTFLKADGTWATPPDTVLSLDVEDGSTTVHTVDKIHFSSGATVTAGTSGEALVAITGGGGTSLTVVADETTVSDVTTISFTSGATASAGDPGVALVAIDNAGIEVADDTTDLANVKKITFAGASIFGSAPDITLNPHTFGGAGSPGIVPAPLSATNKFLRDDGTWQDPPTGGYPNLGSFLSTLTSVFTYDLTAGDWQDVGTGGMGDTVAAGTWWLLLSLQLDTLGVQSGGAVPSWNIRIWDDTNSAELASGSVAYTPDEEHYATVTCQAVLVASGSTALKAQVRASATTTGLVVRVASNLGSVGASRLFGLRIA